MKTVITFVVITLGVLLGVGGLLWQFGSKTETTIADIAGEARYSDGTGSVVLVEFSDFQCPACATIQASLSQVLAKYNEKVQFVYRNFPLTNIHKNATRAAWAAEASYQQGKFWEMHDKLFAKQQEWSELTDPSEKFGVYAAELGLEKDKFLVDMNSQATKDIVETDVLAATKYRLQGTPTFFVNGMQTEFEQLETKIKELVK
ncbi:MAG: thioredoxin domain-containing protein [bacterium]